MPKMTMLLSDFETNKPLKDLSTLGIGGPARYFTVARKAEEMLEIIRLCRKENLPYFILGKGSNCLFNDKGFDGVVILNKISFIKYEGRRFSAGAGYSFPLLGTKTAKEGLSGLEFAAGIPCTVGGAVFMNAGANGQDASLCLESVEYVTHAGELVTLTKDQLKFGYRTSSFQQMQGAIVSATFLLTPSADAKKKQNILVAYRIKTQPYGDMSAGCVFRNAEKASAGALIERCGLKGHSIGGAKVSDMHANFIVNTGAATAKDILALMEFVKATVKEQAGIDLEEEIRCIPFAAKRSIYSS